MSSLHSLSTTRRSTPSRRVRAGLAVAAVLAAVTPLAAGCGAGFDSAALVVKPNSGAGSVGAVKINNVWVVVDPSSGNAEVIGAVANTGSADLSWPTVQVDGTTAQVETASSASDGVSSSTPSESASASVSAGADATGSGSGIPAGQAVSFGEQGQPQLRLSDRSLTPGKLTPVTFSFGSVGSVTVTAQIQSNTGLFADYNPNSASGGAGGSTSSASANPLGGVGVSPSGNATSSVSAGPSDSSSATPSTK